jgi:peptidyl-dipeptidase Dcp
MNPLLQDFNTPPFSKISNTDFKPAIKKAIEIAKAEIDKIINNSEEANFKNTTVALDFTGEKLNRITSIFFNLNAAETNEEIQKIAQEVSPWLTAFKNDITLNEDLFKKVKSVFDNRETLNLTPEQAMLLDKQYKSFARNGANLNEPAKIKLRKIDAKLSKLSLQFGENVLAETNAFEMHLTDKNDLTGLPDSVRESAREVAKSKEKKGWVFTLDYPSYVPFLTYAENRELRKKMAIAAGKKAFQNNEFNNEKIVLKIVNLRHQRANLLGYKTHAHFVLEERMAESPEKVIEFSNNLLEKAKPAAIKEFENLENYAKKIDKIDQLQKWDGAYYSEKLKKELFDLDQELLKPYFKLENVIAGVFTIANRLYDLNFEETSDLDKYHEDVKTYRVTDNNGKIYIYFLC